MKRNLSILLVLCTLFSPLFTLAQGTGAIITTQESRCVATGIITAAGAQGAGPFIYDFISYPADYAYTGPTSNNVITSLNPGNYILRIIDQGTANEFTDYAVTVPGSYIEPNYNITVTNVAGCYNGMNGSISGTLIDGRGPFLYEIIAGPMAVGTANNTGTFTGLGAGTYTVRGYDSCGNFQTRQATISNFYWSVSDPVVSKTACGVYSFDALTISPSISGYIYSVKAGNNVIAISNSLPIAFAHPDATIGNVQVCVTDSCGYEQCTGFTPVDWSVGSNDVTYPSCNTFSVNSITINGTPIGPVTYGIERAPGDTIWSNTLPFTFTKVTQGYFFAAVFVKDGCGIIKASGNQQFVNMWGNAVFNYTSCTESEICHNNSWFYISPVTYTLNGGASQANNCFQNLTDGIYTVVATDACGSTIQREVNVSHDWQLQYAGPYKACMGKGSGASFYMPSNAFNPIMVQTLDASFVALGAPVAYGPNSTAYIDNLNPLTTYNFIATDACGRKDTVTITTMDTSLPNTHATTVTPLCVNKGNINVSVPYSDHGGNVKIDYGLVGTTPPANAGGNGYLGNGGTYSYTNLDTGKYWVRYSSEYCWGEVAFDTVEIPKYKLPKLRKSLAFNCGANSVNIVGSVVGGNAPYTYEIMQTFPVNNPQPPQASNIFNLTGTYTLVRLRVVDACGNTSLQDVAVRPVSKPSMKISSNLPACNLSELKLYVDSFIVSQTYEWKNPAGTVISNSPSVTLTGLSPVTDTGLYTCRLLIPGTCYDITTSFRLRAKDFGCYAKLGNYVWNDINKNGIQDATEVGVAGITVTLYNNVNEVVAATVTDAYGYYLFDNLNPNTYHVGFSLPVNYVFSSKDQGGNDATDSDPDVNTGLTGTYTLASGDSNMTIDAGIYFVSPATASLGDFVWNDTDKDGVQDANEYGIAGVTVTLYDMNGNPVATTITDATGHYYFSDLTPGTYQVGFTSPIGYVFSPQDQGGNDAADSDVNPSTGMTGNVTLAAGENNLTLDAGLYSQANTKASLGNYVWNDVNNDGLQNPEEGGVAGVTVTLYGADGITVIATTKTNEFGFYIFNDLTPGSYIVGFSGLPAGFVFSAANQGPNDAIDSDPDANSGKTTVITLQPGEKNMTVDAGIYNASLPTGALGNFVWYDYNKDGVQGAGENGVPGVTVTLYDNNNTVLATTSTDATGHYIFNNLLNGTYVVGFSNLPSGYALTNQNQGGDDATDSDPDKGTGRTAPVNLALGEVNLTVDAGIVFTSGRSGTATLGDRVWNDENNNGIQDAGEVGVPGVTVTLYASDGVTILATKTTDAIGNYLFTNLDAGSYIVGFSNIPAGFTFSDANQGTDDEADSDADVISNGKTAIYTLSEGDDNLSVDAGIHLAPGLASLGNYVWNDVNLDGTQDMGEPGVPGITVTLFDSNDNLLSVTTTDANGLYQFTGLNPGSYYVEFTNLPLGYEFTDQDAGGNTLEATDSDADPISGATEWVTLVAGQNYPDLDAGIYTEKAGLGNFVWNDLNNDGIQDAGEPGIPGVLVTLYAADGVTPLASAITDASGGYNFVNLESATYVVGFSNIPVGAYFSPSNVDGNDATDSDADQLTGKTGTITLSAGEYNPTVDAGIHIPAGAGLGNYVWFDMNSNGLQDANETGVPGVTVTLLNAAGNAIQATITDQNGYYSFPDIGAGTYSLSFSTLPPNLGFTMPNIGTNDSLDNDVINVTALPSGLPSSGNTAAVTIVNGEYNPTIDAGLVVQFPTGLTTIHTVAFLNGEIATVRWSTMEEKDVQDFEIERSIDNKSFVKVNMVKAKGNTTGNTDYSIKDNVKELLDQQHIYYRVKVYDIDGQYLYSNTVYVSPLQTATDDVVVYPSPFTTSISIGYNATQVSELEIELTDMAGKVITKKINEVVLGQNSITIGELGSLSAGTYFIKILDINTNKTFVKKISKK